MLGVFLPLIAPAALGFLCGALRLFADYRAAAAVLNRYALYVAFPVLVLGSLLRGQVTLPKDPPFYLAHVVMFAIVYSCFMVASRFSGTVKQVFRPGVFAGFFGNIGYLGIPLGAQILGNDALPLVALTASIHIFLCMTMGLSSLMIAGGQQMDWRDAVRSVAMQPLVWAPVVGILAKAYGGSWATQVYMPFHAVGMSAAPVGLFIVGMYLHAYRGVVLKLEPSMVMLAVCKLVLMPLLFGPLAWMLFAQGLITGLEARIMVLMAALPTAVSAFSVAHEHSVQEEMVARVIVLTTALSLVTLPLLGLVLKP